MTTEYPISKTQFALLQNAIDKVRAAQEALNGLYTIILAGHDVTTGGRCSLKDDTTLVLEVPDAPSTTEPSS